jgi:hypothetical protein
MNWQIWAGPAIGLAGLIFATYTYIKSRKPKRLVYETWIDEKLFTQSVYTRWADLSVRFGNHQLKHPRIVEVRVINRGKVEARADDFDEPLAVTVSNETNIVTATITLHQQTRKGRRRLAAEVLEAAAYDNQEIKPLKFDTQNIIAPKTLLNAGDWLEFRLLVDGPMPVQVRGRIAGFTFTPSWLVQPNTVQRILTSYWFGILAAPLLIMIIVVIIFIIRSLS